MVIPKLSKYLFIGDVHAQASDLDDCKALIRYIEKILSEQGPKVTLVFLGDQYNDHAIINAEVLNFWHQSFKTLSKKAERIIALVGNHDISHSSITGAHAMLAHSEQIIVVDKFYVDQKDSIAFVPYVHDKDEFIKLCNSFDTKLLVAHQSFSGAQFENGFFDPSGIDQELVPNKQIICGHIHLSQVLGRVTYLGSPRWRTRSDVNVDKGIWLADIENGVTLSTIKYDTSLACRKLWLFEDKEVAPLLAVEGVQSKDKVYLDIYGSEKYVSEAKDKWASLNAVIRTFKDKVNNAVVKESDGVEKAFDKWTKAFVPKNGTDREILAKMAQERVQSQS